MPNPTMNAWWWNFILALFLSLFRKFPCWEPSATQQIEYWSPSILNAILCGINRFALLSHKSNLSFHLSRSEGLFWSLLLLPFHIPLFGWNPKRAHSSPEKRSDPKPYLLLCPCLRVRRCARRSTFRRKMFPRGLWGNADKRETSATGWRKKWQLREIPSLFRLSTARKTKWPAFLWPLCSMFVELCVQSKSIMKVQDMKVCFALNCTLLV